MYTHVYTHMCTYMYTHICVCVCTFDYVKMVSQTKGVNQLYLSLYPLFWSKICSTTSILKVLNGCL